MSERRVLMEGSHAIAEAAIQAGCRFYAGYPITPSTEILEYMSFRQPQVGGVCVNAESEIEAINMVWGAAGCGVRAMIASTGQGISLMQESLAELSNAQIPCRRRQHDARAERLLSGDARRRPRRLPPSGAGAAHGAGGRRSRRPGRSTSATSGARRSISSATSCSPTPPRPCPSSRATRATCRRRRGPPPAPRAGADSNVTPLGSPEKLNLSHGAHFAVMGEKYPAHGGRRAALRDRASSTTPRSRSSPSASPARFVKYAVRQCRAQGMKVGCDPTDHPVAVPRRGRSPTPRAACARSRSSSRTPGR